ncbi:MAG TPA: AAA family ATPase [Tepidisphaeraceae bacterium]|nr:AAA family ATPase [Tepidisphaeraceae bacterium]
MANEIQIFDDAPDQGLSIGQPPPQGRRHGTMKKIHRLLRGRYPITIALASICGAAGAIGGFMSRKAMYQSNALIQIKSTVPDSERLAHPDLELPGYYSYLRAEILAMSSPDVIRAALQNPQWRALRPGGEDQIVTFSNNLEVAQDTNSDLIKLVFSDPDPAVAKAGANCICKAYLDWYQSHDPSGNESKKRLLEQERDQLSDELARMQYQLDQLREPYGTDNLTAYMNGEFDQLNRREADAEAAKVEVSRVEALLSEQATGTQTPASSQSWRSANEIALVDPVMRGMLSHKEMLLETIRRMQDAGYGPDSLAMKKAKDDADLADFEIEQYVRQYNQLPRYAEAGSGDVAGNGVLPVTAADLARAKADYDRLTAEVATQRESVKKLGELVQQIQALKEKIDASTAEYDGKVNALNDLESQMNLESDQVQVLDPGDLPAIPTEDHRWMMAAVGLVGGGALPVGLLLLVGLLDRRYRYSDETEAATTGVPLLGILPTLPDLSSDPEQAAIAAHCVHQVRTLLQINSPGKRVYTITSASSGDGKTSLTMALGLSFAASGSRTLLIDADLVGAGLTARMGVRSEQGLLEALDAGSIEGFIRPTDVPNLSMLPVGTTDRRYAGTIAPSAVSKLVTEARGKYDVVLVDTGPILGSIEACAFSVASDSVVVCVARGQNRQLGDRALNHLQVIGARLAGVVFNRAGSRDFERSVSRTVIHSLPAHNGQNVARSNGNRMGPIAKAVASSVRSPREGE